MNFFKKKFEELQASEPNSSLASLRQAGFSAFTRMGIPGHKHEEWKYTRIGNLLNRDYEFDLDSDGELPGWQEIRNLQLPGHDRASILVFVNGIFAPSLSRSASPNLTMLPLEEAASGAYRQMVSVHLGHSGLYLKDGINALSSAFTVGGVFVHMAGGQDWGAPLYVYHITDARKASRLTQPRSLIYLAQRANLQVVESFFTLGSQASFSNHISELVVEKDATLAYYKIQHEGNDSNQVSTTHIHQTGKSHVHTVTISLGGGVVRNNLNVVMDAPFSESHLYGLYCLSGKSHVDNHTLVDNVRPQCLSNELYKGIVDQEATGVFNGKIFVRQDAQKTNAYQSNKNILLSDRATVNSKPQLEIFADDVKCSHGCTVGSLDEEALFYLRSRGLSESQARSFLLRAFGVEIINTIKLAPLRDYVDRLIFSKLQKQDEI